MLLLTEKHCMTTLTIAEREMNYLVYIIIIIFFRLVQRVLHPVVIPGKQSSISQAKLVQLKSHLSLGSFDQVIPQNQSIAVPQPNANIINLIRVVGAWKEAMPTKERTRQNAKPCMVQENRSSIPIPVNMGDRIVTTNAS